MQYLLLCAGLQIGNEVQSVFIRVRRGLNSERFPAPQRCLTLCPRSFGTFLFSFSLSEFSAKVLRYCGWKVCKLFCTVFIHSRLRRRFRPVSWAQMTGPVVSTCQLTSHHFFRCDVAEIEDTVSSFSTSANSFSFHCGCDLNGGPIRCSVHQYARGLADELCSDKWVLHPVITAKFQPLIRLLLIHFNYVTPLYVLWPDSFLVLNELRCRTWVIWVRGLHIVLKLRPFL